MNIDPNLDEIRKRNTAVAHLKSISDSINHDLDFLANLVTSKGSIDEIYSLIRTLERLHVELQQTIQQGLHRQ
jgi:hypothetical protein